MTQKRALLTSAWVLILGLLFLPGPSFAFEKLPEEYTISLGNPQVKTKIIEYFSLACPLCLKLLKEEFPGIYNEQISTSKAYWTFHPDPQDITTMQLMICLEKLPEDKKWKFFWEIASSVNPSRSGKNTFLIEQLAKQFGIDVPLLRDIAWIEKTTAYQKAFEYIKQKDAPSILPAIEVNGILSEDLPTQEFFRRIIK